MLARAVLLAVISIVIAEKCKVWGYYARDTLKSPDYEEQDHQMTDEKDYKEDESRSVVHYKRRVKRSDHSSYPRPPASRLAPPAPSRGNQKYDAEGESEESNPKLAFAENYRNPASF